MLVWNYFLICHLCNFKINVILIKYMKCLYLDIWALNFDIFFLCCFCLYVLLFQYLLDYVYLFFISSVIALDIRSLSSVKSSFRVYEDPGFRLSVILSFKLATAILYSAIFPPSIFAKFSRLISYMIMFFTLLFLFVTVSHFSL